MTTDPKAKQPRGAAADVAAADGTASRRPRVAASRATHKLPALDEAAARAASAALADTDDDALAVTTLRPAAISPDTASTHPASAQSGRERPADQASDAEETHATADIAEDDDGDPTVIAQATTPRPRTLSAAIRRPTAEEETPPSNATLPPFPVPLSLAAAPAAEDVGDEIEDDLDPEEEWAIADQPTIYMPPRRGGVTSQEGWPYRVQPAQGSGPGPRPGIVRPMRPREPAQRDVEFTTPRSGYEGPRLASPRGRQMPGTPPDGVPPAALPDPRMERFQQLRGNRAAHEQGEVTPDEMRPVSTIVRQWWGDLLPGLRGALRLQHEAHASGVHPVSPYEAAPSSKLGDAFGRLAQSARDLTDRARPALQRIHDQAEHTAQAIVGRFEQPTAVQQAPFLGPGRVAVFFKTGVTVGQAHALLVRRQARPMRLIPRKHGFLAAVVPGREAEICSGLRDHPYVRDVAYIAYDDAGQPITPQEA
jgi:hypothetical protein